MARFLRSSFYLPFILAPRAPARLALYGPAFASLRIPWRLLLWLALARLPAKPAELLGRFVFRCHFLFSVWVV
jgi:hypothetical protein